MALFSLPCLLFSERRDVERAMPTTAADALQRRAPHAEVLRRLLEVLVEVPLQHLQRDPPGRPRVARLAHRRRRERVRRRAPGDAVRACFAPAPPFDGPFAPDPRPEVVPFSSISMRRCRSAAGAPRARPGYSAAARSSCARGERPPAPPRSGDRRRRRRPARARLSRSSSAVACCSGQSASGPLLHVVHPDHAPLVEGTAHRPVAGQQRDLRGQQPVGQRHGVVRAEGRARGDEPRRPWSPSHICARGGRGHIASSSAVALSATRGSVRATRARMFASVPSRSAPQVNSPCLRTHCWSGWRTALVVAVSSRHSMTPSGVCALDAERISGEHRERERGLHGGAMAIARRRYSVGAAARVPGPLHGFVRGARARATPVRRAGREREQERAHLAVPPELVAVHRRRGSGRRS